MSRSYTIIFGLTADPIHLGHEQAIINGIEYCREIGLDINQFLLMPVYHPNLIASKKGPIASFEQRFDMCDLVAKRLSKKLDCSILASVFEKQFAEMSGEKNYSFNTIEHIVNEQKSRQKWIPASAGMTQAGARIEATYTGVVETGGGIVKGVSGIGETGVGFTEGVSVIKASASGTMTENKTEKEYEMIGTDLLFMVSADHFQGRWPKFRQWFKWKELLNYTGLLINQRPGHKINMSFIQTLKQINPKVYIVEAVNSVHVSSSELRRANNQVREEKLSRDIFGYILKNGLYKY